VGLYSLVTAAREALEADSTLKALIKAGTNIEPAFVVEGSEKDMSPPAFLIALDKAVLPRGPAQLGAAAIRITGLIPAIGNGQELCIGAAERIAALLKTLAGGKVKTVSLDDMGEEPGFGWALLISVDIDVTG
jgi:hypothetical protein